MKNNRVGEIPSYIRYDHNLSILARFLYGELFSYIEVSPLINISLNELSRSLGIETELLKESLIELRDAGYLIRHGNQFHLKYDGLSEEVIAEVLECWNEQNITQTKSISNECKAILGKRIKEYGVPQVLESIKRYGIIYNDKDYFWNYKWSLKLFLKQDNAMPEFTDEGGKWANYSAQSKKKTTKKSAEDILKEKGYST